MTTPATEIPLRPVHRVAKELVASSGFLLARLGMGFKAKAIERLDQDGFEIYDYSVLAILAEGVRATQSTIADALTLDPSRLVALLDSLETRGLIARQRDPQDRRRHVVSITADGKRALDRIRGVIKRWRTSSSSRSIQRAGRSCTSCCCGSRVTTTHVAPPVPRSRLTPDAPTFDDVLAARERISPYLRETALNRYPALDELVGTEVWVKHENHLPVCNFKVRGGVNLVSQLSEDERGRGARHRLDREPRPVDRVRLAALRRARGDLRARGREPGEGRVDPRARRRDRRARPRLRRGARALRGALARARLPLRPLRRTSPR